MAKVWVLPSREDLPHYRCRRIVGLGTSLKGPDRFRAQLEEAREGRPLKRQLGSKRGAGVETG